MSGKDGRIYLGGYNNQLTYGDFWIIKYNPEGNIIWENSYTENVQFSQDACFDLQIDNSGFVYATGYITRNGSFHDFCTIKYHPNGTRNWVRTFHFGINYIDEAKSISLDNSNNVYIAGSVYDLNSRLILCSVKYDFQGNILWYRTFSDNSFYDAEKILTDTESNSFITGRGYNIISTVSYNSSGNLLWNLNGPYGSGTPEDMIMDNQEKLLITGQILDTHNQRTSILLLKYNRSGNLLWSSQFAGVNRTSGGKAIYTDPLNNVYVTGFQNALHRRELITVKFSSLGSVLWAQEYYNTTDSFYTPNKVFVFNNDVYVTGSVLDKDSLKSGFILIKYSQPIGIQPISSEIPSNYSLSQNYPNPFNPTTKISFSIPLLRGVDGAAGWGVLTSLKIYDLLGCEIVTLVNENLKPGIYEVTWDASNYSSGIYYYRIIAVDYSETRKMILIK